MARKNREVIKLELKDLFLDGALTEDQQRAVMKSELWPIFVATYSGTDRNIRVCRYEDKREATTSNGFFERITFSTKEGFNCGMVRKDMPTEDDSNGDYVIGRYQTLVGEPSESYLNNILRTKSLRYAISKLQKGEHVTRTALRDTALGVASHLSDRLRGIVDRACDQEYGEAMSSRPYCEMSKKIQTVLAELFMKDVEAHQIPDAVVSELTGLYKNYSKQREKFAAAMDTASEMFNGKKYILFTNVRDGVIVGRISGVPVQAAIDQYRDGFLPRASEFSYYVEDPTDMPLKWYPSMDAIPEDDRKQIDIQLVMLKAHTGSNSLMPDNRTQSGVYPLLGASVGHDHNGCRTMLLNA